MGWTDFTRRQYARRAIRYASDLTDREWGLISPCLPGPRRLGRPRSTDLREVVNALLYIATTGCQWRMMPRDFPPFTTVLLQLCNPISTNEARQDYGVGSTTIL